jgi:hypothetical protein
MMGNTCVYLVTECMPVCVRHFVSKMEVSPQFHHLDEEEMEKAAEEVRPVFAYL